MKSIYIIYGNAMQYDAFRNWCEYNLPEALEHFCLRPLHPSKDEEIAICKLPTKLDMQILGSWYAGIEWPPEFVIDRIKEQYYC